MQFTLSLPDAQKRFVSFFEVSVIFVVALISFDHPLIAPSAIFLKNPVLSRIPSIEEPSGVRDYPQIPMTEGLWRDLRRGLHYLESSGKPLPPGFVHPGGVAFGELGLSRVAVKDVIQRYPQLSSIDPRDVFKNPSQYECFARYYADLLLRHYLKLAYWEMREAEVFEALQKAWFLGPTLYNAGREVIPSREIKAQEFMRSLS